MFGRTFRRLTTLATVLGLAAVLPASGALAAEDSGEAIVSATVVSLTPLSITLCDTSAEFGTGLDANGSPAVSTDSVVPLPGNPSLGQGAIYQWTPTCAEGSFVTVESGNTWDGSACASVDTNDTSLDPSDLRFSATSYKDVVQSYLQADANSVPFPGCGAPIDWLDAIMAPGTVGSPGTNSYDIYYYLKIDRSDTAGTFTATTTWTVTGG